MGITKTEAYDTFVKGFEGFEDYLLKEKSWKPGAKDVIVDDLKGMNVIYQPDKTPGDRKFGFAIGDKEAYLVENQDSTFHDIVLAVDIFGNSPGKGKYLMNPQGYDWNTLKEQIDVLNEARSDFLSKQE